MQMLLHACAADDSFVRLLYVNRPAANRPQHGERVMLRLFVSVIIAAYSN